MANSEALVIGPGTCLGPDEIAALAMGSKHVLLSDSALEALREARRVYVEEAGRRRVYGYCTGLGALQHRGTRCRPDYEDVILDEHAAGVGPEAPAWLVRAFLGVWLAQTSSGGHPIRPRVALQVARALEAGIVPVVPLYGSVGASGDLAPSAHAMRCILRGRGEAMVAGVRLGCREALSRAGLEPVDLEPGEALAVINNTAWSSAMAGIALWAAERLLEASLRVASYTLEATGFNSEHFGAGAEAKRHPGQAIVARRLRRLEAPQEPPRLQDPYTMRCIPQVYGATMEAIEWASTLVRRESCSPTTNPTVWEGRVWHGCNFHTVYAGLAAETASTALYLLINTIAFRVERLMDSRINGVSDFLAGEDSSVGAMILQYTAASLAAEARADSTPRLAQWLPTSLGQEDANPMSPLAALRALRLARLASWLIAIEATITSLIRRAKGVEDPLQLEASLNDPSGSVARARKIVLDPKLIEVLDSLPH